MHNANIIYCFVNGQFSLSNLDYLCLLVKLALHTVVFELNLSVSWLYTTTQCMSSLHTSDNTVLVCIKVSLPVLHPD